eukprot:165080_1
MTYQNSATNLTCCCIHDQNTTWLECSQQSCKGKYCQRYIENILNYGGQPQHFKCSKHYKHKPGSCELFPDIGELLNKYKPKEITWDQAQSIVVPHDIETMYYDYNGTSEYYAAFDKADCSLISGYECIENA